LLGVEGILAPFFGAEAVTDLALVPITLLAYLAFLTGIARAEPVDDGPGRRRSGYA
jgi:hypothetical protein